MTADPGITAADVLAALIDRDSREMIDLTFGEEAALVSADGRTVDDILLEALRAGLIEGDRGEGDGSAAWWSRVRLTVHGLQDLGQWPPAGREWADGLWNDRYWGNRPRPLLRRLLDDPPHGDFYFMPLGVDGDAGWLDWTALLLLREAGLVSGGVSDGGLDTVRVTPRGREALDPTPRDPLDQAEAELRNGARVDAIVTAVEGGLGSRIRAIAAHRGVATDHPDGHPLKLSMINNQLKVDGAYDETVRAEVESWLKIRNGLAHATDESITAARVEAVLTSIRVFLDEHPA